MNIPKVTHTPRVEAVKGVEESWKASGVQVTRRDGRVVIGVPYSRPYSIEVCDDQMGAIAAACAAFCGCEVVEKKSEAAGSAPTEQMEHRGTAQADAGSSPAASPRPKFVRVTELWGVEGGRLTVGKVYRVVGWWMDRPEVKNDKGCIWTLSGNGAGPDDRYDTFASWVPADDPCEPSEEEWSAALHGYATCSEGHGERVMEALRAAAKVRNK